MLFLRQVGLLRIPSLAILEFSITVSLWVFVPVSSMSPHLPLPVKTLGVRHRTNYSRTVVLNFPNDVTL